jgi:hypothetical protein
MIPGDDKGISLISQEGIRKKQWIRVRIQNKLTAKSIANG